jgi:hypothetical protein
MVFSVFVPNWDKPFFSMEEFTAYCGAFFNAVTPRPTKCSLGPNQADGPAPAVRSDHHPRYEL